VSAAPPLALGERFALVRARAGALFLDTLLVAYAAWCLDFLLVRFALGGETHAGWLSGAEGVLGRRPWLYFTAPLIAALWQTTGESLGLLGNRVRIEGRESRAFRALVLGAVLAGILATVAVSPVLSLVLLLVVGLSGLLHPRGRGWVDLLAGTETTRRKVRAVLQTRRWWQRPNVWIVLVLLGLTFMVGGLLTRFDLKELVTGAGHTRNLWESLFQPDWSITGRVVERMVETVFLALMASTLALPFAFVLSFLGARNVMTGTTLGSIVYAAARVLMNVIRSIEPLVWAIIFVLWVRAGPFAGMLALFVHSVAALGKLYSEAVESIDPGPVEAIEATGANRLQVLRYGIVPQVVPPFLSFTVYRWDINVRMATILGLVGGGGIGDLLMNYQQLGAWSKVGTIIVFITLVVWMMDWLSSKARERLT